MSNGAPNRHLLREWVVQFIFQLDFNRTETMEDALDLFLGDKQKRLSTSLREFFESRVRGIEEARTDLDDRIQRYSDNWDLNRMNAVDRNVLRLAFYELYHCTDVPPVVAVNEAITLAKELSSEESGRFVNGLLDKVIKTLDRPLRQGVREEG